MEGEFDCRPIEELELDTEIIRKLKNIFIYTIGDLQLRTAEHFGGRLGFEGSIVMQINNALIGKTQKGLSDSIEFDDLITVQDVSLKLYRMLTAIGIYRWSELIRLSKVEIQMIEGMNIKLETEIESCLRKYYGEEFDFKKDERIKDSPNTIGLGHLNIKGRTIKAFREAGIYTVGDFQRKNDGELLELKPIKESYINEVKLELERLEISRLYKKGRD